MMAIVVALLLLFRTRVLYHDIYYLVTVKGTTRNDRESEERDFDAGGEETSR